MTGNRVHLFLGAYACSVPASRSTSPAMRGTSMRARRLTGTVVATLLASALALAFTAASAAAAPAGRILIVGDSISQGHEGDFTWRYRFAEHLRIAGAAPDFVGPWTGTNKLPAAYPPGWPDTSVPVHTGA